MPPAWQVLNTQELAGRLNASPHTLGLRGNLVFFWAPWCGFSRAARAEVKAAADVLEEIGVNVAAVDCEQHPEACRDYDVKGFPTFRFFPVDGGSAARFNGLQRDADTLVSFVREQLGLDRRGQVAAAGEEECSGAGAEKALDSSGEHDKELCGEGVDYTSEVEMPWEAQSDGSGDAASADAASGEDSNHRHDEL